MAAIGTGVAIGGRNIRVLQVKKAKDGQWHVLRGLIAPFEPERRNTQVAATR